VKKVLIVAHFSDAGELEANSRFSYIAENLAKLYDVELISSDFSHTKKQYRVKTQSELRYKVTLLHEPAYRKNVSPSRLISHRKFAGNLKKYLNESSAPDLIYCAVPSLDVGDVAREYALSKNILFIIDIQDIWPEAFKLVFNIPLISDTIFAPMTETAKRIYADADEIIAVSETYAELGAKQNSKIEKAYAVFLGTDLTRFDEYAHEMIPSAINKFPDEFWVTYIGTLGHSYNITCILDAMAILKKDGYERIKFLVMGDGPLMSDFERHAKQKDVNALFTGRLGYPEMVTNLVKSDVAVNPINDYAAQSIINKVGDYAAAGLPVISTQQTTEYKNLIKQYNIGYNCGNDDPADIAKSILELYQNPTLCAEMGRNNRKLAEEKFDRAKTYDKIYELIKKHLEA
jgi:glycosyltransferase involved in cell wall biosynthesis